MKPTNQIIMKGLGGPKHECSDIWGQVALTFPDIRSGDVPGEAWNDDDIKKINIESPI